MKVNTTYNEDVRYGIEKIPDNTFFTSITSPPYWGLRDYSEKTIAIWDETIPTCDHEWESPGSRSNDNENEKYNLDRRRDSFSKSSFCRKCNAWRGQLGHEPHPDLYIKHLCDIYDLIKPKIRDDGTVWINLGDTYGGSGNASGHTKRTENFGRKTSSMGATKGITVGFLEKSLVGIPFRFALEMINRGWLLRNTIIWHKGNSLPCPVKDRFTVNFEYLFFFSKSKKYYFEQQFEPYAPDTEVWYRQELREGKTYNVKKPYKGNFPYTGENTQNLENMKRNLGKNKRAVWKINTKPFPDAHFAVYPKELLKIPIQSCCPEFVCAHCGKPKVKQYEKIGEVDATPYGGKKHLLNINPTYSGRNKQNVYNKGKYVPTCNCNEPFEPGIVLDPFMGAGTTKIVAKELNRRYIGFEINEDFMKIIENRSYRKPTRNLWGI